MSYFDKVEIDLGYSANFSRSLTKIAYLRVLIIIEADKRDELYSVTNLENFLRAMDEGLIELHVIPEKQYSLKKLTKHPKYILLT